ncbi:hypothetical protein ACLB2K_019402 [Fragaria x ananassa]
MPEDAILEDAADRTESHDCQEEEAHHRQLKTKKLSWQKLRRFDSLDIESHSVNGHQAIAPRSVLIIMFIRCKLVCNLATSISEHWNSLWRHWYITSICVCENLRKGIKDRDDILGVLSLIIYTITLIPLIKYVFIVLQANDNGDGKI